MRQRRRDAAQSLVFCGSMVVALLLALAPASAVGQNAAAAPTGNGDQATAETGAASDSGAPAASAADGELEALAEGAFS